MGARQSDGDERGTDTPSSTRRGVLQAAGVTALGVGAKAGVTTARAEPNGGYGGTPRLSEPDTAPSARRIGVDTRHTDRLRGRDAWYTVDLDAGERAIVRYGPRDQGVAAVGLFGPDGDLLQQAYTASDRPMYLPVETTGGTHYLQVADLSGDRGGYALSVRSGAIGGSRTTTAEMSADQSPYEGTVAELPGRVQAQNFDLGGEGVSYHDETAGNEYGEIYRDTDVDVRDTRDQNGAYNVGYFQQGEWLEYTVDAISGTYSLHVRAATPRANRRLRFTLDGEELGTVSVSNTGGWRQWQTVTLEDVTIRRGDEGVLRVEALDSGIDFNWFEFDAVWTQRAYGDGPVVLPGRVQAENFDLGGEGVSYHDETAGNEYGEIYRDTDVDVRDTRDQNGAYNVGYFQQGEWLEYTVDPTPGIYELKVRAATPRANRRLRFTLDGEELGTVSVSNTGGWRQWQTVTLEDVSLPAGEAVLRIEALDSGIDFNWFEFEQTGSRENPTQNPFEGTIAELPGRVQAENFDTGGEGVAYHDETAGNEYGEIYRDTDVDVRDTRDQNGGYNLGYVQDGEWVEYTVDPAPGTYDVRIRVATPRDDRKLRLLLDGEELGIVGVPNTGGWRQWETATLEGVTVERDAESVLRIEAIGSGIDINWTEFVSSENNDEIAYGEGGYGGDTYD